MTAFLQDLRHWGRFLSRNPAFFGASLLTLSLAIGANTAIFSMLEGVLYRPLPFRDAEQLATVRQAHRIFGDRMTASLPNFLDWQRQSESFSQLGAYANRPLILGGDAAPERITASRVTSNLFAMLGVEPHLGRSFQGADQQLGGAPVAILSNALWQRRFGGDPAVLGKQIHLDGAASTVIGIMPPGFRFPLGTGRTDLWIPLVEDLALNDRDRFFLNVVGRLKDEVTLERAQSEIAALAQRIYDQNPSETRFGVRVYSLHDEIVGGMREPLWILAGAGVFLLLIACVNVGGLLLSIIGRRQGEMAVRTALGANWLRLLRQLLSESLLLGLLGALGGILVALLGFELLLALHPPDFPRFDELAITPGSFGYSLLFALGSGLLIGCLPALTGWKASPMEPLKQSAKGSGLSAGRLRLLHSLVAVQIALAVLLVGGAGLLIQSFWHLLHVDLGFQPDGLHTMRVWMPQQRLEDPSAQRRLYQRLLTELAALPEVLDAGAVQAVPLGESHVMTYLAVEGRQFPADELPRADFRVVEGDYFKAMGTAVVEGRAFSRQDREGAPAVAIINQALARRLWPGQTALGKRIAAAGQEGPEALAEVVGVVQDVRHAALAIEGRPAIYRPLGQYAAPNLDVVVRSRLDPASLASALQAKAWELDPDIPLFRMRSLREMMGDSVARTRFHSVFLSCFAAIALLLGSVGAYGVVSCMVSQRRHEIGVRMAFGATRRDVVRSLLSQGGRTVAGGLLLGLAGALALADILTSQVFGVSARDPINFAAVLLVIGCSALLAVYLPSRRATRLDPVTILRAE